MVRLEVSCGKTACRWEERSETHRLEAKDALAAGGCWRAGLNKKKLFLVFKRKEGCKAHKKPIMNSQYSMSNDEGCI